MRVSYKQLSLASAVSRDRRSCQSRPGSHEWKWTCVRAAHDSRPVAQGTSRTLAQVGDASLGTRCETFSVFFWMTVSGGLLLAISVFYDPRGITAIGGLVLFVLGVALVFSRSLAASRREATGLLHAIVLSVRKALRFAWALMP